jgi:hypothetical protein
MGRYRVVGLKVLPRFGSGGLGVRSSARPGEGPIPVEVAGLAGLDSGGVAVDEAGVGLGRDRVDGVEAMGSGVRVGWVRRLFDALAMRRNPFTGSGLRASRTAMPRQGCLELEGLKAVHNDLSDMDYELVSTRPVKKVVGGRGGAALSVRFEVGSGGEGSATEPPLRSGAGGA